MSYKYKVFAKTMKGFGVTLENHVKLINYRRCKITRASLKMHFENFLEIDT